jgi:hypothetical protein
MNPSLTPAESTLEKMWTDFSSNRNPPGTAEIGPILHVFYRGRLTGCADEDCYTFERVAPVPAEIHSNYYYHYKKNRLGLKEESTWS